MNTHDHILLLANDGIFVWCQIRTFYMCWIIIGDFESDIVLYRNSNQPRDYWKTREAFDNYVSIFLTKNEEKKWEIETFSDSIKLEVIKTNLEKYNGNICCEACGKIFWFGTISNSRYKKQMLNRTVPLWQNRPPLTPGFFWLNVLIRL